jgi:hypothetical protein
VSVIQSLFLDLIAALWIAIVFATLFFWLPEQFFSRAIAPDNRTLGTGTRMTLMTVAAVLSLSTLHLFNWLTLVLFYGVCFLANASLQTRQNPLATIKLTLQRLAFIVLDLLDRGLSPELYKKARQSWRLGQRQLKVILKTIRIAINNNKLTFLALAVILTFAILSRLEYPLQEMRFTHSDRYGTLLATRQLIAGEQAQVNYVPVLPAIAAVISLLGGVDAMQVVRFLCPLWGLLLVLSVGYNVRSLTQNTSAALIATFSLGAYLFTWSGKLPELPDWWQQWLGIITQNLNASLIRQWAGGELEIGATFLLVAIALWGNQKQSAWIDSICSLAIVTLTAPILLILAGIGAVGLIGGRRFAFTLVAIAWVALGLLAATPEHQGGWERSFLLTLPVGLSLLGALLSLFAISLLGVLLGRWSEVVCLLLVFAISINFLLPLPPKIDYLEYEIAARKTLELRSRFPIKSWVIAAPLEQLAESYGAGWHEDLAMFVQKYVDKVGERDFQFSYSVPHLFVFVEKKPFVTSLITSQDIPNSLLDDPTYRYYRSTAGRASLQYEALQMCETYRRLHADTTSIDYEDEELRIYHFAIAK